MPLYRWNVRPAEPEPPYGVVAPGGVGATPEAALSDLRRQVEWERERAASPVAYYDELLSRMSRAD